MHKQMSSAVAFIFLSATLFGCASPSKNMINPQTLSQVRCSSWGVGVLGAPIAAATYSDCVSKYTFDGYIDMSDFERNEGPKVERTSMGGIPADKPVWDVNSKWIYIVPNTDIVETIVVKGKTFFENKPVYELNLSNTKSTDSIEQYLSENIELLSQVTAGKKQTWDPPSKVYDWPLVVNKSWDARATTQNEKGSLNTSVHSEVRDYGKVTVLAGTYDVFYIVAKNDYGMRVYEVWYSPQVKNAVRRVIYGNTAVKIELQEYIKGQ